MRVFNPVDVDINYHLAFKQMPEWSACDVVGMIYLMSETEESPQVGTKILDNM